MTNILRDLIASATAEARPRFACDDGDHFWEETGGRQCPMGAEGCSQPVFVCKNCGVTDYGDSDDSPGKIECQAVCGDSMTAWKKGPLDPNVT